jgi:phage shock protein PspC (stress-responsive transcriptional regulator)
MNKILNINLGGFALTIDDDAYEYLSAYIDNIRKRFSESEGRDEILHDIENRLGELISIDLGNRTIVMLPDVEAAIQIMGKPEDFGTDPVESTRKSSKAFNITTNIRTGKRLFRDEDDSVVAGICSGLSAYFGMTDPVWMRLIFVLLAFISFGFWVPAYLLLWILIPPAKTAADRLTMRGEPVNVDNIAKEIEEGFDRFSDRMSNLGASDKKKGANNQQNAFGTFVSGIGTVFAFVMRLLGKFGIFIAIIVGLCLFFAMALGWMGSIWGLFAAAPYFDYFSPYSSSVTWLGFTNVFFLLGIPVVGLCLLFIRVLFKIQTPSWLKAGLVLLWLINLGSGIILGGMAAKEYRRGGAISQKIDISDVRNDTLRIEAANIFIDDEDDDWWINDRDLHIKDSGLEFNGGIEITVRPSESGVFECVQTIKSRGSSGFNAEENASKVQFSISKNGNIVKIPTSYAIQRGDKWRGQEIRVSIGVPIGKSIVFGKHIYRYARSSDYQDMNDGPYFRTEPEQVFEMTNRGLVCTSCPKIGDKNYRNEEHHYENFILEGDFITEIRQGERFRVSFEGENATRQIETIRSRDKITFTTNGKKTNGTIRILIETPTFTSLHADNSGEIILRGFDEGHASITSKNSGPMKAIMDVNQLSLSLIGSSTLSLTGSGNELKVNLTDGAQLEAPGFRVSQAEISASNASRARLNVEHEAVVRTDASSNVKIDGTTNIQTNKE